ncbi:unnamed protein product, partial [Amoebophrya sp. A25]
LLSESLSPTGEDEDSEAKIRVLLRLPQYAILRLISECWLLKDLNIARNPSTSDDDDDDDDHCAAGATNNPATSCKRPPHSRIWDELAIPKADEGYLPLELDLYPDEDIAILPTVLESIAHEFPSQMEEELEYLLSQLDRRGFEGGAITAAGGTLRVNKDAGNVAEGEASNRKSEVHGEDCDEARHSTAPEDEIFSGEEEDDKNSVSTACSSTLTPSCPIPVTTLKKGEPTSSSSTRMSQKHAVNSAEDNREDVLDLLLRTWLHDRSSSSGKR